MTVIVVQRDADLLLAAAARHAGSGFTDLLDGRKQEADEDSDDCDDDQQFDQGEAGRTSS